MIHWTGENHFQTAKVGEYELQCVLTHSTNEWLWAFVPPSELPPFRMTEGIAATLEQAKTAAEKAYLEHVNK